MVSNKKSYRRFTKMDINCIWNKKKDKKYRYTIREMEVLEKRRPLRLGRRKTAEIAYRKWAAYSESLFVKHTWTLCMASILTDNEERKCQAIS